VKFLRKRAVVLSVLALLFSLYAWSLPVVEVKADPGAQGWTYRKSHTLYNATGAGTNYQMHIRCHFGAGGDYEDDVYLNGKARSDFADVRFTDSAGNFLDYWLQRKVDSDYADFWVEVSDDLSSQNRTIYIYYGKPDASSASSGPDTFIAFDDFKSGTGWTYEENRAGFNGAYDTEAYISPSQSYKLYLPSSKSTFAGDYCQITRSFTFPSSQVKIQFYVYDSYSGGTSGYHVKKAYLDGTLLYSDDVAGDEGGWVQVDSTQTPTSGSHTQLHVDRRQPA